MSKIKPLSVYSVEVPGAPDIPGETKPRRHPLFVDKVVQRPVDVNTALLCMARGLKVNPKGPAHGTRSKNADGSVGPFTWITYEALWQRISNIGAGMKKKYGLSRGAMIGLFSINRSEWVIAEYASFMHSWVTVPIYDTLGSQAVAFILEQTEMEIIVATMDKVKMLVKDKSQFPTLKHLIVMDEENLDAATVAAGEAVGLTLSKFSEVEAFGKANPAEPEPCKPEDTATICYTSGTTGNPKGAELTHGNFVAMLGSLTALMDAGRFQAITKEDSYLSYLPLAHVMERAVQTAIYYHGSALAFYQGDTAKLMEDLGALKPTIFVSVPRLYNKIYDGVLGAVNKKGGIAKKLFDYAFESKKYYLKNGQGNQHALWDKVVFKAVREKLGGRTKWMLSGSAPLSGDVIDFFKIVFGAEFLEGYGQTENFCVISITDGADAKSGHVGAIQPACEVKLVDVPELNYRSTDKPYPRGEICVRGPAVCTGYYKDPEKTAELIDKDGWQHSGDIGQFGEDGRLQILDRVKNIFKLSQGEYVAPEKIEIVYVKMPIIQQIFMHGDSLQPSLVCIIVPEPAAFEAFLAQKGLAGKDWNDQAVRKAVLAELASYGKAQGLKGFEMPRNVYFEKEPFSMENGYLTPTFKMKRAPVAKAYRDKIDAMYAEKI